MARFARFWALCLCYSPQNIFRSVLPLGHLQQKEIVDELLGETAVAKIKIVYLCNYDFNS